MTNLSAALIGALLGFIGWRVLIWRPSVTGVYLNAAMLATFPLYYMLFAAWVAAWDFVALEALAGLPFFLVVAAAVVLAKQTRTALLLLGVGYIGHGLYDFIQPALFQNPGAPFWWPAFCGTVDVVFGVAALWLGLRTPASGENGV
jgi:hypothetical protein